MDDFFVRGFSRQDAKEIVRIHSEFNEWFEELGIDEDFVVQASMRPDFRFFVAESGGRVIGFAGVLYYESVGRAEFGPICVEEGMQRTGVGSAILSAVKGFLCEKGIHRVVVKVKSGNNAAMDFFSSQGFRREAVLEKYTKGLEDAVQMAFLP